MAKEVKDLDLEALINKSKSWNIGSISKKTIEVDGVPKKISELRLDKKVKIIYDGIELPISKFFSCSLYQLEEEKKSAALKSNESKYNFNTTHNVAVQLENGTKK